MKTKIWPLPLFFFFPLVFILHAEEISSKNWNFSTGLFYHTSSLYRGALVWTVPSFMPFIGIKYKNIQFNGPGITAQWKTDKLAYSAGTSYFNDEAPLIKLKKRSKDFRNERKGTYDFNTAIAWEFIPRFLLSIQGSYSMASHHGFYIANTLQVPLIPFCSASYTVAFANEKANHYAYGVGAVSGLAHRDFGLSAFLPFLPKKGSLVAKYTNSRIHKEENKRSSYVLYEDKPEVFLLMATWKI